MSNPYLAAEFFSWIYVTIVSNLIHKDAVLEAT